jgi:hypothetical protein
MYHLVSINNKVARQIVHLNHCTFLVVVVSVVFFPMNMLNLVVQYRELVLICRAGT